MPTGKGFALDTDLDLRQALIDGCERHRRRQDNGLRQAPARHQKGHSLPNLRVAAITNDTVATLASLAYSIDHLPNSRVVMGLVVGAGCNSAIPMKLTDLHERKTQSIRANNLEVSAAIVNTEWTLNDNVPLLREMNLITKWDKEIGVRCYRPGFRPLEYMTGGRYVGELVRIIMYNRLHD